MLPMIAYKLRPEVYVVDGSRLRCHDSGFYYINWTMYGFIDIYKDIGQEKDGEYWNISDLTLGRNPIEFNIGGDLYLHKYLGITTPCGE